MKQALIDNLQSLFTIFGIHIDVSTGMSKQGYSYFQLKNLSEVIKDEDGTEMTILEWFTQHMTDKAYSWLIPLSDGKVISYRLNINIAGKTSYLDTQTNRTVYHTKTSVSFSQEAGIIVSDGDGLVKAIEQQVRDYKLTQDAGNKVVQA
jgi:hypothetical protein